MPAERMTQPDSTESRQLIGALAEVRRNLESIERYAAAIERSTVARLAEVEADRERLRLELVEAGRWLAGVRGLKGERTRLLTIRRRIAAALAPEEGSARPAGEPRECGEPHPDDPKLVCRKRVEPNGRDHGGGHIFAPPTMTDEQLREGLRQLITRPSLPAAGGSSATETTAEEGSTHAG